MAKVKQKHPNESFEQLLRRFKKAVDNSDIIKDIRKGEFFEKDSSKRKRKAAAAVKREEKRVLTASLKPVGTRASPQ